LHIIEGYQLSEELEYKIMTKKRFSNGVETLVSTKGFTYIEAITHIAEERGMEYNNVKRLLSDSIKQKLEAEASNLKLIQTPAGNKLPL
tara:strand:+ start:61 stop:327 length:267 start_codon:yes stop_codon:yes gene_type:complete